MESKTNFALVGLSVLILLSGLIGVIIWLSDGFNKETYLPYWVYMDEPVSGLTLGSPVKFNGVKIGVVAGIDLNLKNPQQVKILLNIVEGTPITISTQASLMTQGITGSTYLGLSATSPSLTPITTKKGEIYPIIPYHPSFFNQLEKNINLLSDRIELIFDKENAQLIKNSLTNLSEITHSIASNSQKIQDSLQEIPILLTTMKESMENFDTMAQSMTGAGKLVSKTMNSGRIAIDKFSQQIIPSSISLLRHVDSISSNLEILSAHLRENPAIMIRGTNPPHLGPGEHH